ncbi:MAG: hypothetical protein COU10_03945 [Candidatus Harrisonbacteria bacterium CG10_big_fil_rev_8_21_14_0_10_45_28]|uniref:PD-(D/E)XK endonuclease-like domain-containing protein n=1 Tax=Candidatus Harrisonbacteria bacterium CG10_big_fil_rev_8_21_14_0_10_45_28 TaxID=1974586 RepID=A0A2H0UMF6_9BACT|nr:MAG: hypothetical protein COU10_03945 [Candidatus Harrisonbacteria bacterium CG10_big_fil_rev_8_21_14_0_10_45_28]
MSRNNSQAKKGVSRSDAEVASETNPSVQKAHAHKAQAISGSGTPSADIVEVEVASETESQTRKEQATSGSGALERAAESCPYCESKDFVKRGIRKNKHQVIQLYLCRNITCGRTFTSSTIKGKQFPWVVVLDAISYYNLGYTFEQCSKILEVKFFKRPDAEVENVDVTSRSKSRAGRSSGNIGSGAATSAAPKPETIASWYEEYKPLCRFTRLRPYAMKILATWRSQATGNEKFNMVETTTLAHRQLYRFRYHRPKLLLQLEEYKNRNFGRLMEYLDVVSTDTPHQYFAEGARMSEIQSKFDKTEMIIKSKTNFANDFTRFVLQGVPNNKDRHEVLQRFMIANDSVTVATEVPVYIRKEDVAHLEQVLKFKVTKHSSADVADAEIVYEVDEDDKSKNNQVNAGRSSCNVGSEADDDPFATSGYIKLKGHKRPQPFPDLVTGHIDIVQVRNGIVHILDYKPNADKERPIEQLTWYALALSRLTGLRLFEFKCAWFDEHAYYEFYPLHVVKKLNRIRTKKVRYRDGKVATIPKVDELHIIR